VKKSGTSPNQARKLSPNGWKESDKSSADSRINKKFFIGHF